jgi:hypothetical protein
MQRLAASARPVIRHYYAASMREFPDAAKAVEALYTLKFALRRGPQGLDFRVMPLEGLWWARDMSAFRAGDKASWEWTAMIAQPEQVDDGLIERLHAFIAEQGYRPDGKHHEIYLGDPRRAAPEKLKTIVRQPCAPALASRSLAQA